MSVALDPNYIGPGVNLFQNNLNAQFQSPNSGDNIRLAFADTARSYNDSSLEWAFNLYFSHSISMTQVTGFGVALASARSNLSASLRTSSAAIMYYSDGYVWQGPTGGSWTVATYGPPDLDYVGFRLRKAPFTNQARFVKDDTEVQSVIASGGPWYPVIELNSANGLSTDAFVRFEAGNLYSSTPLTGLGWFYLVPFLSQDNRNKHIVTGNVPIHALGI